MKKYVRSYLVNMKYAQKFNLRCYDQLKEYFKLRAAECTNSEEVVYAITNISQEITDLFNAEMTEHGLPCVSGWLLFKKKSFTEENHRFTHVDGCDVSVVLPLEGYEDTHMYWCDGDYQLSQIASGDNIAYYIPVWSDNPSPEIVHREMIISPTICRVDLPHYTVTDMLGNYRIVITARFVGNPSFEEVCEKLGE